MTRRLRRLLDRRARPLPPRLRTALLAATSGLVIVAAVWAWRSSDLELGALDWWAVVVLFVVLAPASLALKAAEFDVAARIAGHRPAPRRALSVAVLSSAANLLPLPGSLLVTVRSLAEDGTTYGTAVASSAVPGLAWLGITGVVGGIAIAAAGSPVLGAAVVVAGLAVGGVAVTIFRATAPADRRGPLVGRILLVEVGWLLASGGRLGLALVALGEQPSVAQALALSVAGAVTVAVGVFPGGLGLREALIAGLAPLIGLPFDTGVLVGVLDRLVWLVFLALAAAAVAVRGRTRPAPA